ncbi:hypothetical protein [Streptomyces canus]|uniref:hypothetical protein n=1 Tax=Streptomyces canus TaxID=58343 RepID=UPI00380AFF5E
MEVAAFEAWDAAGRTFDLVTCGDAWHWIDPVRGVGKAAEVLNVGGTIARFWTSTVLDEAVSAAFDPIYRMYAPEVAQYGVRHRARGGSTPPVPTFDQDAANLFFQLIASRYEQQHRCV